MIVDIKSVSDGIFSTNTNGNLLGADICFGRHYPTSSQTLYRMISRNNNI